MYENNPAIQKIKETMSQRKVHYTIQSTLLGQYLVVDEYGETYGGYISHEVAMKRMKELNNAGK